MVGQPGQGGGGESAGYADLAMALAPALVMATGSGNPQSGQMLALLARMNEQRNERERTSAAGKTFAAKLAEMGIASDPSLAPDVAAPLATLSMTMQKAQREQAEKARASGVYGKLFDIENRAFERTPEESRALLAQVGPEIVSTPELREASGRANTEVKTSATRQAEARKFSRPYEQTSTFEPLLPPPAPPRPTFDDPIVKEPLSLGVPLGSKTPPPISHVPFVLDDQVGNMQRDMMAGVKPSADDVAQAGLPLAGFPGGQDAEVKRQQADATLAKTLREGREPTALMTPQRLTEMLERRGLTRGTPEFDEWYANMSARMSVPGVGAVGGAAFLPEQKGAPMPTPPTTGASAGALPTPLPTPAQAPAPSPGARVIAPLVPAPMSHGEASGLVHKRTLETPPPGMTKTDPAIQRDYLEMPTTHINRMPSLKTFGRTLDSMEAIIKKRPDLWPVLTGNDLQDAAAVSRARIKFTALTSKMSPLYNTDPVVARFMSNKISIPQGARAFGEVGNLAQAEQQVVAEAVGLEAGGQQASLERLNNIRDLINGGLPAGLTFRLGQPAEATSARKVDALPPASPENKGWTATDPATGRTMTSDGKRWVR